MEWIKKSTFQHPQVIAQFRSLKRQVSFDIGSGHAVRRLCIKSLLFFIRKQKHNEYIENAVEHKFNGKIPSSWLPFKISSVFNSQKDFLTISLSFHHTSRFTVYKSTVTTSTPQSQLSGCCQISSMIAKVECVMTDWAGVH